MAFGFTTFPPTDLRLRFANAEETEANRSLDVTLGGLPHPIRGFSSRIYFHDEVVGRGRGRSGVLATSVRISDGGQGQSSTR